MVNVSSRMDRLVSRGLLTYGTVKAALTHMTRLLAVELAPRVRVNAISPGVVHEPTPETLPGDTMMRGTPAGRPGTPDAIAQAAVYLASDEAAFVQGAVIDVDGGRTTVAVLAPAS